jgi:hypothetical protein
MKLLFPLLPMLPAASVAQSQLPSPQPNNLNLPFVLSVIGAFIASFVVAQLRSGQALRMANASFVAPVQRTTNPRLSACVSVFGDELCRDWIRISRT